MNRIFRLAYTLRSIYATLADRIKYAHEQFPQIQLETITEVANQIPGNGKYLLWTIKQIKNFGLNWAVEHERDPIIVLLQDFMRISQKPSYAKEHGFNTNLDSYDYWSLNKNIFRVLEQEKYQEQVQKHALTRGTKTIYDKPPWKIIEINADFSGMEYAVAAAIELAQNTNWCTKNNDFAEKYLDESDSLYVIFKNEYKYAQASNESNEFDARYYNNEIVDFSYAEDQSLLKVLASLNIIGGRTLSELKIIYIPESIDENDMVYLKQNPKTALQYVRSVLHNQRCPELEPIIATNSDTALLYARLVLNDRFPAGEKSIMTDPHDAANYAELVLKQRWPEAEHAIRQDHYCWNQYKHKFNITE